MNRIILLTTFIFLSLMSFSCKDSTITDPSSGISADSTAAQLARRRATTLTVSTSTLSIAATASSTASFNISSNTNWNVSSDQTWLTVSSATGSNNAAITITAAANTQNVARTAVVTVSATYATAQKVTITQEAATAAVTTSTGASPYTLSAPIVLNGKSNMTINYLEITNPNGHCIELSNCSNITIQYCKLDPSKGEGVYLYKCSNITIKDCTMEYIETGVLAEFGSGIKVDYNDVKNVQGPMPRGQLAQFAYVNGADCSISYNVVENISGQSNPEDAINLYMSSGTAASPIQVIGNKIRGGGPSTSGGGIVTGDNGGSYEVVKDNILVNPGQYGLAAASGHDIEISNNKVYSAKFVFTNIGLFAWKQYDVSTYNITISNNAVNYTNKDGVINDMWNAGNCGTVAGWSTNYHDSSLSASILPAVILGGALQRAIDSKK